jgi:hypothetical protein
MYEVPQLYGTEDYMQPVSAEEGQAFRDEAVFRVSLPFDDDVAALCFSIMGEQNWQIPKAWAQCVDMYFKVRQAVRNILQI